MSAATEKEMATKFNMKYVSLVTLTVQNAALGLSMRYARTRPGDMFLSSTAVLFSELCKLFMCLWLVFRENNSNVNEWKRALIQHSIKNPMDTFKVCVPSLIYVIQNNLLYVAASHLDAATYQVTYQLKILTTALFSVAILNKKLLSTQWFSLLLLMAGVILVQLVESESPKSIDGIEQNRLVGFSAALAACVFSGFAGIYFEKILKGSDISVWMRNIQLSFLSLPFGLFTCLVSDWKQIHDKGFLFGYDAFIWYLIMLQACGGLLVAMVVKYADNILKGFATSLAIILSCIVSIYVFSFHLTFQFVVGASLVISSVFLYSYVPKPSTGITNKV
uniref:EOG090X098P n=1 Tax=Lynceus sp. MCZ IZ 141354 TaxID=1930659 RepID=A0A9N6ZH90_9CRUS|nr:EOG090X098P [Lynceus sp. MCZ IZ 141354]